MFVEKQQQRKDEREVACANKKKKTGLKRATLHLGTLYESVRREEKAGHEWMMNV